MPFGSDGTGPSKFVHALNALKAVSKRGGRLGMYPKRALCTFASSEQPIPDIPVPISLRYGKFRFSNLIPCTVDPAKENPPPADSVIGAQV